MFLSVFHSEETMLKKWHQMLTIISIMATAAATTTTQLVFGSLTYITT